MIARTHKKSPGAHRGRDRRMPRGLPGQPTYTGDPQLLVRDIVRTQWTLLSWETKPKVGFWPL